MTIKDGIKLGIGFFVAQMAINFTLQLLQLAWLYLVLR
jgi:hypothetical protein